MSQLLVAGADANTFDKGGSTPLTNLISTSARPSLTDPSIMDDVMTIVVLLQQKGAELNSDKCEYSNPLMVATLMKCGKLVEYFLNCGANPNMKCKHPCSVIDTFYGNLLLLHPINFKNPNALNVSLINFQSVVKNIKISFSFLSCNINKHCLHFLYILNNTTSNLVLDCNLPV